MSTPPPLLSTDSPISQPNVEQLAALHAAERSARKIRRAARFATGDAWSIAIVGALTLLTGFNNLSSILLAGIAGVVAWQEFRGAAGLRRFDPPAATRLAFNQIVFAAGIIAYSMWQLHVARTTPSEISEALNSDAAVAKQFGDLADLGQSISTIVYDAMILGTILTQGSFAIYYLTRRRLIDRHLRDTPSWAIAFQRRA